MLERITRRLFPHIHTIQESARQLSETIARQNATIDEMHREKERPDGRSKLSHSEWQLNQEMSEALMLAGSGPPVMAPTTADIKVKERFWELELALEDRGWTRQ